MLRKKRIVYLTDTIRDCCVTELYISCMHACVNSCFKCEQYSRTCAKWMLSEIYKGIVSGSSQAIYTVKIQNYGVILSKMGGSLSSVSEDWGLTGYDPPSMGDWFPMF